KSLVPAQPDNNTINPANQTMQRMDDIKFSTKKLEVDLSRFVREKYTGIQTKTNFRIEFSYGTALIEEIRIFEDILCL
ncbi:MAG: hypothetical protein LWY06_05660, partial [Firmicutes bacterium]|nr:hypothetical protein [Bacillota bacterium]